MQAKLIAPPPTKDSMAGSASASRLRPMNLDRNMVLDRLKTVPYPGFTRDIVTAGVVRDAQVREDGVVIQLELPPGSDAVAEKIRQA
ncbi:MAG: DUF59 domain-containing protein, partial [Acidobacteria bacterium]